jgi:hypothetical protein
MRTRTLQEQLADVERDIRLLSNRLADVVVLPARAFYSDHLEPIYLRGAGPEVPPIMLHTRLEAGWLDIDITNGPDMVWQRRIRVVVR